MKKQKNFSTKVGSMAQNRLSTGKERFFSFLNIVLSGIRQYINPNFKNKGMTRYHEEKSLCCF